MAKRHPPGGGRKGPETECNREMRKAFERPNNKENRPVDNRSLIPQLMRELVEVHGGRRAMPQPQQPQRVPEAAVRRSRRFPPPPREMSATRPQVPQPGPSSQSEQGATASGYKWGGLRATRRFKARDVIRNQLTPSKPSKSAWEGRSLRSYIKERQRDSGNTFECIDATHLNPKDADNQKPSCQLSPDEQFELDTMLAIERSLVECFTPVATPFHDVKVPEKDEGMSVGKMTIQADVHQEGTSVSEFASGGQTATEYPHQRATAEQISAEPQYAVPHKKKNDDAPAVDPPPSPSSDSSSDRPPTPHPRIWPPVTMKYYGENCSQNIHQEQGYEDKIQQKRQHILTDEEQFHLDTQLAIQHSLQKTFIRSNERYFGEDEVMAIERQEKQPTRRSVRAPVGLKAQYAVRNDTVMVAAKRETETDNVPVPVHTGPPKPARLYVRGVNAPPGMMEPISSIVPRISNVQCPPPDTNDEVWENIIPEEPVRPQQDLSTQEERESCCESYMEIFMETVNAMGRCFRVLGHYTWRYICHCEPIPGTCAYN